MEMLCVCTSAGSLIIEDTLSCFPGPTPSYNHCLPLQLLAEQTVLVTQKPFLYLMFFAPSPTDLVGALCSYLSRLSSHTFSLFRLYSAVMLYFQVFKSLMSRGDVSLHL